MGMVNAIQLTLVVRGFDQHLHDCLSRARRVLLDGTTLSF